MQPHRHDNRVLRNTLSLFTGQTGAQVLALVFAAYLSKHIPTDAYGCLSFALSFVVIFNVLSEYGLWTLLVRTMARDKEGAGDFFWNSIVLKAALAVMAMILGGLTLFLFYPGHDLQVLTCLAAGWLLFNAWYFSAAAVFRAFQEHHLDGTLSFIGKVLYVGVGLVIVHVTRDVRLIAALFTAAMAVQSLLAVWLVVKRHPEFRFTFSIERQWHLLRHAWLFFVISAFTTVNLKFALMVIARYCARSDIGYYSVAAMLVLVPIVLANAFVQSLYPVLAECHERGGDGFWEKVAVGMRWLAALAFPVIFFMSIDGARIITTVFRKEFVAGLVPMQILLWGLGLDFFNPFSGHVLYVLNRQKTVIAITGASVATTIIATLVLTPRYGIVGASVAMVLSLSVMFWGYALALRRWLPLRRLLGQIGVPMAIAAALTPVPWVLRGYVPFWINGPLYCMLCAAAYFASRALCWQDTHIFGGACVPQVMDRQRSGRKKILYVHHGTGMGGAPQLLLRFMQRLDPARYEPVVWCIRKSSASDLFEQHGFTVIYEPDVIPFLHISDGFYGVRHPHQVLKMAWGQIRSYRAARRVFGQVQPDMIHVNSVVVPGVLCAAAREGCPVVVNVLECVHPGYTGLRGALLRHYTKKWATGFVFMLPSEARRWGLLGTPTCVSVFDFIDLTLFSGAPGTDLRTDYHVPADTALIGYLGRFTTAKGVHLLVQALGELKRKGVKFHALLIGPVPVIPARVGVGRLWRWTRGTPYIERLRALIMAEGIEHEVTFTGERLDATRLANQFDVVAVPFIEPHFSRLCAEAAAAGVVAVAFAIDGPGEEIIDGQTGLLARPFDAHDLAAKIGHALGHPAARHAMGDAARRRAADVFDAERNIAGVLALYHQFGV